MNNAPALHLVPVTYRPPSMRAKRRASNAWRAFQYRTIVEAMNLGAPPERVDQLRNLLFAIELQLVIGKPEARDHEAAPA